MSSRWRRARCRWSSRTSSGDLIVAVEIAHRAANDLGESVVWDAAREQLVWVDIPRARLLRRGPAADTLHEYRLPERVGAIGLRAGGGLVLGLASGFAVANACGGDLRRMATIEDELPTTRLNDGRVDRQGRFVCGGMNEAADQRAISAVYRLGPSGSAQRIIDRVTCANSLCFSPDGERMYFSDTPTGRICAYAYDAGDGVPRDRRTLADLRDQPGLPDGSAIDVDGCLWNAQWGGSRILRITPAGVVDRVVELPVTQPTCPAFGGPGLSTLYVTSARFGLPAHRLAAEPHAGDLLAIDVGVSGMPEPLFAG